MEAAGNGVGAGIDGRVPTVRLNADTGLGKLVHRLGPDQTCHPDGQKDVAEDDHPRRQRE